MQNKLFIALMISFFTLSTYADSNLTKTPARQLRVGEFDGVWVDGGTGELKPCHISVTQYPHQVEYNAVTINLKGQTEVAWPEFFLDGPNDQFTNSNSGWINIYQSKENGFTGLMMQYHAAPGGIFNLSTVNGYCDL